MYNYGNLINSPIYDEERQQQLEQPNERQINQQDSFSFLTNFMADKIKEVDDKIDMIQKSQAGTRQQISELHSMLNELLFRERSK